MRYSSVALTVPSFEKGSEHFILCRAAFPVPPHQMSWWFWINCQCSWGREGPGSCVRDMQGRRSMENYPRESVSVPCYCDQGSIKSGELVSFAYKGGGEWSWNFLLPLPLRCCVPICPLTRMQLHCSLMARNTHSSVSSVSTKKGKQDLTNWHFPHFYELLM